MIADSYKPLQGSILFLHSVANYFVKEVYFYLSPYSNLTFKYDSLSNLNH